MRRRTQICLKVGPVKVWFKLEIEVFKFTVSTALAQGVLLSVKRISADFDFLPHRGTRDDSVKLMEALHDSVKLMEVQHGIVRAVRHLRPPDRLLLRIHGP